MKEGDNSTAASRWNCWEFMKNATRRIPSPLDRNYSTWMQNWDFPRKGNYIPEHWRLRGWGLKKIWSHWLLLKSSTEGKHQEGISQTLPGQDQSKSSYQLRCSHLLRRNVLQVLLTTSRQDPRRHLHHQRNTSTHWIHLLVTQRRHHLPNSPSGRAQGADRQASNLPL